MTFTVIISVMFACNVGLCDGSDPKGSIIKPMAVDLGPIPLSNFDYLLGVR